MSCPVARPAVRRQTRAEKQTDRAVKAVIRIPREVGGRKASERPVEAITPGIVLSRNPSRAGSFPGNAPLRSRTTLSPAALARTPGPQNLATNLHPGSESSYLVWRKSNSEGKREM